MMDYVAPVMDALYTFFRPGFGNLKWAILALGLITGLVYLLLRSRPAPFLRGLLASALAAAAIVSVVNYNSTQWRNGYYLNAYEFFHYYLGAKYAPELGYTRLYAASVLAQREMNIPDVPTTIRDLDLGRSAPADQVLARNPDLRSRFSDERWTTFQEDIRYFRGKFKSAPLWKRMHSDKGYNAGPVWTLVGGVLANAIPTRNAAGMQFLTLLDPILLTLAFLAVWGVYGHVPALFMVLLLGAHHVGTAPSLHAAFLRYDWLVALILAACCLKRNHFIAAGILVAYSTSVRVFPLLFVLGLAGLGFWTLLLARRIDRKALSFGVAFALSGVFLGISALVYTGGIEYTREFIEKITGHNEDLSAWRVGFKYFFMMNHGGPSIWDVHYSQAIAAHPWMYRGTQGAMLLLALLLVWRKPPDEALLLGMIPVFFLVSPTYYYYVMLLLPMLYFASKPMHPERMFGVLLLFASGFALHWILPDYGRTFPFFWRMSAMVLVIVLYMAVVALTDTIRELRCVWKARRERLNAKEPVNEAETH